MARFIVRRLLLSIPVLLGVTFIVFALARIIPGDPCRASLGERATDAACDDFIHRYGLDQPIPVQFVGYLGQLLSGDLGQSIKFSRPVTTVLVERLPTTIELTFYALLIATVFGVTPGAAVRPAPQLADRCRDDGGANLASRSPSSCSACSWRTCSRSF